MTEMGNLVRLEFNICFYSSVKWNYIGVEKLIEKKKKREIKYTMWTCWRDKEKRQSRQTGQRKFKALKIIVNFDLHQ